MASSRGGAVGPHSARRRPAGGMARCRVDPKDDWVECRVVDINPLGAATALEDRGAQTRRVVLELRRAGSKDTVELRGAVRHTRSGNRGTILGVEFGAMDHAEERVLLELLLVEESPRR